MKLSKTARAILSVTALAWSIPFAQADDTQRADRSQAESAEVARLDAERNARISLPRPGRGGGGYRMQ